MSNPLVCSLMEYMERYQREGLSFFPLPYKSKESYMRWKRFQECKPSDNEVKKWADEAWGNLAVVCGRVSGNLVVLDFDDIDEFYRKANGIYEKTGINEIFDYTLCVETSRGIHMWLRIDDLPAARKYPGLDVKSEGGYVLVPPSIHPSGKSYEFINPAAPIKHLQTLNDIGLELPGTNTGKEKEPSWVTRLLQGAIEGQRNDSAIRLAGYFRNILPIEITERILLDWNHKNVPPMSEDEIKRTIKSAYKLPEHFHSSIDNGYIEKKNDSLPKDCHLATEANKNLTPNLTGSTLPLSKQIQEWIRKSSGWFDYSEIDREFGLNSPKDKQNRLMILKRLEERGVIESHKTNNKLKRFVQTNVRVIDFKNAGRRKPLAIKFPFQIEELANTYPGNIIVIAGAANSGKTAFLLNFVRMNMHHFNIYYQSSEMGGIELANRLECFENIHLDEWNFTAEERSSNFADVIRPDCINIIDYMEFDNSEFYRVNDYLRAIHEKLNSGICIVAIQKNRGSELGRGGNLGLEKPRLYLTMDAGLVKIQKAKNWARFNKNPNGLQLGFKIVKGCKFITTSDWYC